MNTTLVPPPVPPLPPEDRARLRNRIVHRTTDMQSHRRGVPAMAAAATVATVAAVAVVPRLGDADTTTTAPGTTSTVEGSTTTTILEDAPADAAPPGIVPTDPEKAAACH